MVNTLKALFFYDSLRRWHFEALVKESGFSRERINYFLKQLIKEKLIARVKPRGKMPYHIANRDSSAFRSEKKLYGLSLLEQSGLFGHLCSCQGVKTAILFGSFARGDWGRSSDIDLFVYGDDTEFMKEEFESKLKKEIQLFSYQEPQAIKKQLDPRVIPNIIKGFNIKGSVEPFEVIIHA
jgi:predicted nucleotidyltransferase